MKNLKSFKFCLASRSHEAIPPQENPVKKAGEEDCDVMPEPDNEFRDPNYKTLNRDSIKNRDSDASKFETLYNNQQKDTTIR